MQLAFGRGMSNSRLLIALFYTNVLGRINPTIMETVHDPSSRAPDPISVLPLFSFNNSSFSTRTLWYVSYLPGAL